MSTQGNPVPSAKIQAALDSLRQTVAITLERKRRLGQYVVTSAGGVPTVSGDDAPKALRSALDTGDQ